MERRGTSHLYDTERATDLLGARLLVGVVSVDVVSI